MEDIPRPLGHMGVDPDAKRIEQCATKVLGEMVPGSGSTRDIVVGVESTTFSSEVLIRSVRPKFSSAVT